MFFGDLARYMSSGVKTVTVGLNPSRREFPVASLYERFPLMRDAGACGQVDPDTYVLALSEYFHRKPLRSWFGSWEPLLEGMGCSFYGSRARTALHTDLCSPLATDPTWSQLTRAQQSALDAEGVLLWRDLLQYLAPDVVLISVAQHYLARIPFPHDSWKVIYRIERTHPYEVLACEADTRPGRRSLLAFGRAAQMPFGTISDRCKREVGTRIRAHLEAQ
ncbi:MAG: hypothetical protein ACYDEB_06185 [Dehalococcoidia bacterium]